MNSPTGNTLNTFLSDDEYELLARLLAASQFDGRAMDVSMLEGFLTAIVIGPNLILPHDWLVWVWDKEAGAASLPLAEEDASVAIGLIMRHYNDLVEWMRKDPGSFEPIFTCGPDWGVSAWCDGFLKGMRIDRAAWAGVVAQHADWFAPFTRLGADMFAQTEQDGEDERWMNEVAPSVVKINALLMARRGVSAGVSHAGPASRPRVREMPKVGRNDPCSCGSGKKFKKCCGDA